MHKMWGEKWAGAQEEKAGATGLGPWGVQLLDYMRKRFSGGAGSAGSKGGGAAHKKIEAPQSIDGGDARRRYSSHQSPVTSR